MMIIILLTSLIEIFVGVILLRLISIRKFADSNLNSYIAITGCLIILYDLSAWTIIWHVSFKYWETARQFSRMVRMI